MLRAAVDCSHGGDYRRVNAFLIVLELNHHYYERCGRYGRSGKGEQKELGIGIVVVVAAVVDIVAQHQHHRYSILTWAMVDSCGRDC